MDLDTQKIIEYEMVIPKCIRELSSVAPGVEVIMRDDLVLICTKDYPSLDTNHAFLLRTSPAKIDGLIDEVVTYFREKELPAQIMVSPACAPADISQRLLQRGFVKQEPDECWIYLEHIQTAKAPKPDSRITVKHVEKEDVELFAETMVAAYEMMPEWTPMLATALGPTVGHPNINHYLAFLGPKPVATVTTMQYKEYVVVGSGGVLPEHRGTSMIYNLALVALIQARENGADTILGQTVLGPRFERFLRICGLKQAFKRQIYILE